MKGKWMLPFKPQCSWGFELDSPASAPLKPETGIAAFRPPQLSCAAHKSTSSPTLCASIPHSPHEMAVTVIAPETELNSIHQSGCSVDELDGVALFRDWHRKRPRQRSGDGTEIAEAERSTARSHFLSTLVRLRQIVTVNSAKADDEGSRCPDALEAITGYFCSVPASFSVPLLTLVAKILLQIQPRADDDAAAADAKPLTAAAVFAESIWQRWQHRMGLSLASQLQPNVWRATWTDVSRVQLALCNCKSNDGVDGSIADRVAQITCRRLSRFTAAPMDEGTFSAAPRDEADPSFPQKVIIGPFTRRVLISSLLFPALSLSDKPHAVAVNHLAAAAPAVSSSPSFCLPMLSYQAALLDRAPQ